MADTAGWSDPLKWQRAASRNALRQAIAASEATRTLSTYNRLTIEHERLERQRQALLRAVNALSEGASDGKRDALTQQILRYHSEVGDLERRAAAACPPAL